VAACTGTPAIRTKAIRSAPSINIEQMPCLMVLRVIGRLRGVIEHVPCHPASCSKQRKRQRS
jgi:hypothetical protein